MLVDTSMPLKDNVEVIVWDRMIKTHTLLWMLILSFDSGGHKGVIYDKELKICITYSK